jgi:hypothetical protein
LSGGQESCSPSPASSSPFSPPSSSARRRTKPTLAIVDVAIVDVTNGAVQPHRTVLVSGSRIAAIGPTSA